VVGQAWRDGPRQAVLSRFLRSTEVDVVPMSDPLARACGELCGRAGTADVIDASIVLVAREHRDIILTSDPRDLERLDPTAAIVAL
ncbi:MAG TPA: PIN domain-containing protein, partial [Polyangiaceae bacterium]|nr:PIN domain-containing protein [Polyangiaceae bacterium]